MHRTTLSFGDEDWRKIRRIATARNMTFSQLVALAIDRLKEESASKRSWHLTWKPKMLGKPNADFRTREGIYEFLSD